MSKRHFGLPLLYMMIEIESASHAQVVTAQYDNFRTGVDLYETVLKPSNVNTSNFGKLFSRTVDGDVFAQPLYVPSLTIPGVGKRNVVFVVTEHDSVYAFDVNGTRDAPFGKISFVDPQHDTTTLTEQDVLCPFITPEVGITPTPVIDAAMGLRMRMELRRIGTGTSSLPIEAIRRATLRLRMGSWWRRE